MIHEAADLSVAAVELGYPSQELVVKPRQLSGGRGIWLLRDDPDPRVTSPAPQISLEALALMLDRSRSGDPDGQFLVQQLVAGVDVSVEVLAHDGRAVVAVGRTREMTLGGLCVARTVHSVTGSIRDFIIKLVSAL